MHNSADIRRDNRKRIYRLLLDGRAYTKQQVAAGTGLSVATCNTLLNEMLARGVVTGESQRTGEVGRSSMLYRIDDAHERYLAVSFRMDGDCRVIACSVLSAMGREEMRRVERMECLDAEQIIRLIGEVLAGQERIARILVAPPGITERGVIRYGDVPELENAPLQELLERAFDLPVTMENDMHCMAYGYSRRMNRPEDVITLACYPTHLLPGTATIHKGMIIQGAHGIAGMAGFLPCGMSREEQLRELEPGRCIPYVARSLSAIMVLLNPGVIVLTGDLIEPDMLEEVRRICAEDIPEEYMPEFVMADSFEDYLQAGLFALAVDNKII